MTDFSSDKLRELYEAATTGDLSTAERHIKCETVECPACQGDGELDAADYCNFDGVALGVQFYGIGGHFGAHEALWRYFVQNILAILAMAEREKRMREAGNRLAFAAGALNIATDSAEHLTGERGNVLDALKGWESALGEEKAS